MTAPNVIWADPPEIFDGMDIWRSEPGGKGVRYIRADAHELLLEGLRQIIREFGGTSNGHRACVIANETIAKWEALQ